MTEVRVMRQSPRGWATVDTKHLFIGTNGQMFIRNTNTGAIQPLSADQQAALNAHFGSAVVEEAVEAVEALS